MDKKDIKILIIVDDVMLNKIYQTKLYMLGYNVISAFDGEEGLHKITTEIPNLILLDLMLPKKNGFEILEIVKQDIKVNHIPIIILSNLGQEDDLKKGMELGATDFLVKSNIKLESVVEKIENLLQQRHIQ